MIGAPQISFINFFGFELRLYSIFMALAMICGCSLIYFMSKLFYRDDNYEILLDFFPLVILSGILGARIYYVLFNLDYFSSNISEIIMINHGGISIHGAILGGLLCGYIFCKVKKISFLHLCDLMSFGLILGQAIGRVGNYFNSEAFGAPCNYLWKMYVMPAFRPLGYKNFEYFHPTFLYEIIWNVFVLLILFLIAKKCKNKSLSGLIFFSYLTLYSLGRFFIEEMRLDNIFSLFGIHLAQVVSVLFFIIGIFGIIYVKNKKSR